ncbi:hypothetical protein PROPEN_01113 [Proteus penneri ATCC 35198]|nr:hypothetical protein PROPEN_01113 [Proteus penneri ATCC 35198]
MTFNTSEAFICRNVLGTFGVTLLLHLFRNKTKRCFFYIKSSVIDSYAPFYLLCKVKNC